MNSHFLSLEKYDKENIKGKPYFGYWFGTYVTINFSENEIEKQKIIEQCKCMILKWDRKTFDEDLERRNQEWIIKEPGCWNQYLINLETIGMKVLIWGRAFKIMRLLRKGAKRYKKIYQNGRRILKRIDK